MRIPLSRPDITQAEVDAVIDVMKTPQLSLGPKVPEFEQAMSRRCGTKCAVACNSGTSALHLCFAALNVGPGDEVITTPFSFIASSNSIMFDGGVPVFVDIDDQTWNIDPAEIEAAVTPRTKAILPVHVFGHPPDLDAIMRIGHERSLPVIEDSCEALGALHNERPAGSVGQAGVFGFYPNKQMTTGEGGMIVTDDAAMADVMRSLRNQGRGAGGGWLAHERLGYNYRLPDINCAIGIVQLRRLDEILAARARVAAMYRERLQDDDRLRFQKPYPRTHVSWFVFVVRLDDSYDQNDRDRILAGLAERGIGCNNYFTPIHLQPFYRQRFGFKPGAFPRCEALSARTVALPFHGGLTEAEIDEICHTFISML